MMVMRALHRSLAMLLSVFIVAHLVNHLMIVQGPEAHLYCMDRLRAIYRLPLLEPLLYGALFAQAALGIGLAWHRGWPRRTAAKVQTVSGIIFALFIIQHLAASIMARQFSLDIDTDVYWAASVVSRAEFAAYFVPYYFLGVSALFVHVAAHLRLRGASLSAVWSVSATGMVAAGVIVAGLMGAFGAIDLPPPYVAYLNDYWF